MTNQAINDNNDDDNDNNNNNRASINYLNKFFSSCVLIMQKQFNNSLGKTSLTE